MKALQFEEHSFTLRGFSFLKPKKVIYDPEYFHISYHSQPTFPNELHLQAGPRLGMTHSKYFVPVVTGSLLNSPTPHGKGNESLVNCSHKGDGEHHHPTHKAECPSRSQVCIHVADEHRPKNPCCTSRCC
jgi:hypothetical protein